jgi:hypothetical protein
MKAMSDSRRCMECNQLVDECECLQHERVVFLDDDGNEMTHKQAATLLWGTAMYSARLDGDDAELLQILKDALATRQ